MADGSVHTLHATQVVHRAAGDEVVGFLPRSSAVASFEIASIERTELPDSGSAPTGPILAVLATALLTVVAVSIDSSPDYQVPTTRLDFSGLGGLGNGWK